MSTNPVPSRLRGILGEKTRAVLDALYWSPQRLTHVMDVTGLPREKAWPLVKHLVERGLVERTGRGLYHATGAGRSALNPVQVRPEQPVKPERVRRPALGWRWSKARVAWLVRFYPVLGPHRCAVLLGRDYQTVHAKATRLGLQWGRDIEGFALLADVARLLDRDYASLYNRARKAGALTFPATAMKQDKRRKALVPDWWVDLIAEETRPPEPGEVPLATLREELGLSKTHAQRLTAGTAVLRVPLQGGQAQLHVSAEVAARLRSERKARPTSPAPLGRPAVYAALHRAGPNGLTEKELREVLNAGAGMIRMHTRALYLEGQAERCRTGTSLDPFVYRLALWQASPPPEPRPVTPVRRRRAA